MTSKFEIQLTDRVVTIDLERYIGERLQYIAEAAHRAYSSFVEGDFVEFGIQRGTSTQAIAAALAYCASVYRADHEKSPKKLFLFDSFQGFPEATAAEDIQSHYVQKGIWAPGRNKSPGVLGISKLVRKFYPEDLTVFFPGWFEETVPHIPKGQKFVFVHLDCDLYSSSMTVLTHLFENNHIANGCHLLMNDILVGGGSKQHIMRKAWLDCVEKYNVDFTEVGFYGATCWHCVIHR